MHWVLFSSGARPQYLENDSRCLALYPGLIIQFRYEEKIICDEFKAAYQSGTLIGQVAYLTYLDLRDRPTYPFVVLREARIAGCEKRGSVYIIKLKVKRYIRQSAHDLQQFVRSHSTGLPGNPNAHWVVQLSTALPKESLVAHDHGGGAHLEAFEETAERLSDHEDFREPGQGMFLNVLDIFDKHRNSVIFPKPKRLIAGGTYTIIFNHYHRVQHGTRTWSPYWLSVRSNYPSISVRSEAVSKINSDYDEREIVFSVTPDAEEDVVTLDLRLVTAPQNSDASLELALPFSISPKVLQRWMRIGFIMFGLSLAQVVALLTEGHLHNDAIGWWTLIAVFFGSLLAAIGAVRGYKISI